MTREEIKKGLISYLDSIKWGIGEYHEVFGSLINMLSLSEKDEWIPVSERLPEKVGTYLVTLDYKEHGTGITTLWFHGSLGWDLRVADAVTVWMPLPSPWKGEADGK